MTMLKFLAKMRILAVSINRQGNNSNNLILLCTFVFSSEYESTKLKDRFKP